MKIIPSHIAVLVPSVRKAADYLKRYGFQIGPEEEWDGEGTKEIYVESGKSNSLLLMEPVKAGAYQRAMDKRGPGLHHLAIDVPSLDEFLKTLPSSDWILHPISEKTILKTRTAWLYRKNFPALIEVQENAKFKSGELFVNQVLFPETHHRLEIIGLNEILGTSNGEAHLKLQDEIIPINNLF